MFISSTQLDTPPRHLWSSVDVERDVTRMQAMETTFNEKCSPSQHQYEIYHWEMHPEEDATTQNFGDEIGPALISRILGFDIPLARPDHDAPRLLAVGSTAHFLKPCDVAWGIGVRTYNSVPKTADVQIHALRGPMSRKALLHIHPDLYVPEIYGDPALLIPRYFPEWQRAQYPNDTLESRIVVIPHKNDLDLVGEDKWYKRVSPVVGDWREVVKEILNATFVISSSLHGLAVADAFGIPSRGFRIVMNEPDFKFVDYYEGTGRTNHRRASSVREALWMGPEDPITNWDAQALIDAFPFGLFRSPAR